MPDIDDIWDDDEDREPYTIVRNALAMLPPWAKAFEEEGLDIYFDDGSMMHVRLDCCTPEKLDRIETACRLYATQLRWNASR